MNKIKSIALTSITKRIIIGASIVLLGLHVGAATYTAYSGWLNCGCAGAPDETLHIMDGAGVTQHKVFTWYPHLNSLQLQGGKGLCIVR